MNPQTRRHPVLSTRCALAHATAWVSLLSLGACSNLAGVGGESRYACKAPVGVACDSVSGTYANALQQKLPSQRLGASIEAPAAPFTPLPATTAPGSLPSPASAARTAPSASSPEVQPLRAQARILRLWIKPWEDSDGDLYDQGYVYVQVSSGQWLIDHLQRQIRDAYAPLRAPGKAADSATQPQTGSAGEANEVPRTTAVPGTALPLVRPAGAPSAPSSLPPMP